MINDNLPALGGFRLESSLRAGAKGRERGFFHIGRENLVVTLGYGHEARVAYELD